MNKLKISHHLCYICHKNLSISSKKMYCRVYSLESGYLCDLCKKPFGTGYASKKPLSATELSARSFCTNRTKTVKRKQMKTTDCKLDKVSGKRMPNLKCAENFKRKQMKTTDRIQGIQGEVPVKRVASLKSAENVERKAGNAHKLKNGFVKKLSKAKIAKASKKELGGARKILSESKTSVEDVRKFSMDPHDIQNLEKMSKCVVRIRIDPLFVEKIMEYENHLKDTKTSQN